MVLKYPIEGPKRTHVVEFLTALADCTKFVSAMTCRNHTFSRGLSNETAKSITYPAGP